MQTGYTKDIQTLEQYSQILCDDQNINHQGAQSTSRENALFPIKVAHNKCSFLPGPEFSTKLYRGQNEYFEICKPTLLRRMSATDKINAQLQKLEFVSCLKRHPLTKYFETNYFLQKYKSVPNYKLKIDYEALAQHYEFKTTHLDLSRDKNVAMFFMTCKYDPKNKKFYPVSDNSTGVFYTYDLKSGLLEGENAVNPVGFQPFARPDKQKAFSVVFNKNINFNNFNFVHKEHIKLTKELCEKYFNMFEGGTKIFPKEEISDLAYEIQNDQCISKDTIECYSQVSKVSKSFIMKTLSQNSMSIIEKRHGFNIHLSKHMQNIINDLEKRISLRGMSSHMNIV